MEMIYEILDYILPTIGVSSIVSAIVAKDWGNKYINAVVKIINIIGCNIWNAKNADNVDNK